jgi:hypothetical protein
MGEGEDKRGTDESNEREPVTPAMQRIYDAMLIKTFRADKRMTELGNWLKPWGIDLQKHNLKRCPKSVFWAERVQEMVGRFMRPLADRLWDTDKTQDVSTLNWMVKIQLGKQYTKWDSERKSLVRKSNIDRKFKGLLQESWDGQKRSNQWKVTK